MRTRLLAVGILLACSAAASAYGNDPVLDLSAFELVADGQTDNTEALNAAFIAAARDGLAVELPSGAFGFAGVIKLEGVTVRGQGNATRLVALDASKAQLQLTSEASISDLSFKGAAQASASASTPIPRVLLKSAEGARIDRCTFREVSFAIEVRASKDFAITHCRFMEIDGPAIRITTGSHAGLISSNRIQSQGHAIEIFSQDAGDGPCHDILITANTIDAGETGRGIAVNGGRNVSLTGNQIGKAGGSGIWVGTDGNRAAAATSDILIRANQIDGAGWDIGDTMGALHLTGTANEPLTDVTLSGNQISRTPYRGLELNGVVRNLAIEGNSFVDIGDYGIFGEGEDLRDIFIRGNRFVRLQAGALRLEPGEEGVIDVAENFFRRLNLVGNNWEDAIHFFEVRGDQFELLVRGNLHVDFNDEEVLESFVQSEDPNILPTLSGNVTPNENRLGE